MRRPSNVEVDMKLYLEQATLRPLRFRDPAPLIPAEGQRSDLPFPHLPLGGYRKLKHMQCLKKREMNAKVAGYYHAKPLMNVTNPYKAKPRVRLPAVANQPFDFETWSGAYRVDKGQDIVCLIEDTLVRAARILYKLDRTTKAWTFERYDGRDDPWRQIPTWEPFTLINRKVDGSEECKLAVFTFPPWLLSAMDMEEFTRAYSLQQYAPRLFGNNRQHFETPLLEKSAFLWMMLNDYCFTNNCHRFVITTYNCWVFGGFSDMFSSGYCSEPCEYTDNDPTILSTLVYWMHSSFDPSEAWTPPVHPNHEEYEDTNYDEVPCTFADLVMGDPKASLCISSC